MDFAAFSFGSIGVVALATVSGKVIMFGINSQGMTT
jgi:hypothetical protein